jgi:GNAT superfamily N-acetyltransferase
MTLEIAIRPARVGEARSLSELAARSKAYWGYSEEFIRLALPELTIHEREIRQGIVWVADGDGRLAGVATVTLAGAPELAAMFVEPEFIGEGGGTALLRHVLAVARAAGARELVIESDPHAEPFYRSHGAERIGERTSAATGRSLPLLRIAT